MSALLTQLRSNRSSLINQAQEIAQRAVAESRDLTSDEQASFDQFIASAEDLGRRADDLAVGEQRTAEMDAAYNTAHNLESVGVNPLSVRADVLDQIQSALQSRTAGTWEARAALTTTNTLGRQTWHGAAISGPRMLHTVAGIPADFNLGAVDANYLRVGALAVATGVAEGDPATELTSVTGSAVKLMRYGRWTELSEESKIASDAAATLTLVHRRAIARDLDSLLIGLAAADSPTGSAVTGSDAGKALRRAIAIVSDNVGVDASELTIIANPAVAGLIEDVAPIGGSSLAEATTRFAGAKVYYSNAAPTGAGLVIAPTAFRYLEAMPMSFRTDINLKTSTLLLATSLVGGYGNQIIAGGVQRATLSA